MPLPLSLPLQWRKGITIAFHPRTVKKKIDRTGYWRANSSLSPDIARNAFQCVMFIPRTFKLLFHALAPTLRDLILCVEKNQLQRIVVAMEAD